MLWGSNGSKFHWSVLVAGMAIMLMLAACGGGEDEEPTSTPEPTVAAAVAPSATPEPAPTETATPEPTATPTPTPYVPAPTVAAPLYEPPAPPPAAPRDEEIEPTPSGEEAEPTPVDQPTEPPPDTDIPEDPDEEEVSDLLLSTDLKDLPGWENEIGWAYTSEEGFHIVNTDTSGRESWELSYAYLEFGNIVASIDVRNVGESPSAIACLAVRTAPSGWEHAYTLCLSGFGESFADYKYVDAEGAYLYEELVEFAVREGTRPPNEWNTLTIVASGQDLGFFVNDELLGVAVHPSIELGGISFVVGNYEAATADWAFTNLEVWAIE